MKKTNQRSIKQETRIRTNRISTSNTIQILISVLTFYAIWMQMSISQQSMIIPLQTQAIINWLEKINDTEVFLRNYADKEYVDKKIEFEKKSRSILDSLTATSEVAAYLTDEKTSLVIKKLSLTNRGESSKDFTDHIITRFLGFRKTAIGKYTSPDINFNQGQSPESIINTLYEIRRDAVRNIKIFNLTQRYTPSAVFQGIHQIIEYIISCF